jgi:diguanylate cyclase (GGDEF)-like protein
LGYSRKLGPPLTSASVATIVVANFCTVWILARAGADGFRLFNSIWPIVLATTMMVVLVMSFLHESLQQILQEMDETTQMAVSRGMYDPLTGLANRVLLKDRLGQAIERHRRTKEKFGLLMFDLDHFKKVNDVLGHHVGDELLKQVASRVSELTRETDTVARLGGDEFVIVLSNISAPEDAHALCERIIESLSKPFRINNREVTVGASIGAILGDQTSGDTSEYLRLADIALYRAKDQGRNGFRFFTDEMDAQVLRRANIENSLRRTLRDGVGLEVHYQPQIDVYGKVTGLEALLRWNHPDYGWIQPSEIIPIAEEVGLIEPLGKFVFEQACITAARFPDLSIAVNVSALQFAKSNQLVEIFKNIAHSKGVPCEQIEIEITENVFVEQGTECEKQINSLRSSGFRIALDDFGTGYSSLSYLRRFNVDKIKLDKSFADYGNLHNSVALIRAVVTLAHTLGLQVMVEGIESAEQEQVALEAGCDGLQGYHYGEAVSADKLDQHGLLRKAA